MEALIEASHDPHEDWHAVSHAFAAALSDVGGIAMPTLADVEAIMAELPAGSMAAAGLGLGSAPLSLRSAGSEALQHQVRASCQLS